MIQSLQLVPSLLAQMSQTFGASAVIMSPLFDLFLLVAAVLLIIAFFKYTEPNSAIRNFMTGYGLFELLRNGFNYLFVSNQTQNSRVNLHHSTVIHAHPSHGFFPPASPYRSINSHLHQRQNSFIHGYDISPGRSRHMHGRD